MQETERDSPFGVIWWVLIGLCLIIVPFFLYAWRTSRATVRVARATAQLATYQTAITIFKAKVGRWPTSLGELRSNAINTVFINGPPDDGDPWSRLYIFVPYNSATGYGRILTLGRDGKPGGTGADADIERRFP